MKRYNIWKISLILFAFLLPAQWIQAQNLIDLNGFRLWQLKTAVYNSLGKPQETVKQNGSSYDLYFYKDHYIAFEYSDRFPHNVFSIQLTGNEGQTIPFEGFRLGDSRAEVDASLGQPISIKPVPGKSFSMLSYKDRNVTLEVEDNRLSSIRITITNELMKDIPKDKKQDTWSGFVAALMDKDIKAAIDYMRPDMEIYRDSKVYYINKAYVDFLDTPEKNFVEALIGDNNSLRTELQKQQPESALRLHDKLGVGIVYKFNKSKVLNEVYLVPYNGRYVVYEIAFRDRKK